MRNLRTHFGGLGNRLFQLAYVYAQARRKEIPDIYIQDPKYFEGYEEEVKAILREGVEPIDMVSVHIRRGDYLGNPFYVNLSDTDYYEDALAEFPKGTKFLVFCADRQPGSDDESDMQWCRAKFGERDFEFFQGKDEIEDFNAMAGCKAHIIANSSFSYMAAFASGNPTIAPSKWYAYPDIATAPTFPSHWKTI